MLFAALPLEQFLNTLNMTLIHAVKCTVQSGNALAFNVWRTIPFPLFTSAVK